jgi:hypothetical protein
VVWQSIGRIQLWNGAWLQTLTLLHTSQTPEINDAGQVVWRQWDGADQEIYLYTPSGPGSVDLLSPNPVVGGETATGVVILSGPAPAGGAVVSLATDHPEVASVPASVTVPAGERWATFPVATQPVPATRPVLLSASYDGSVWTTTVRAWHVALAAVTLDAASYGGGVPFSGTVTLDEAAPAGGAVVTLTSSSPAATVVSSVQIPAGQNMAFFSGQTRPVAVNTPVTITAAYGGTTRAADMQVRGGPPKLAELHLSASRVFAGEPLRGTVVLDGFSPTTDTIVTLVSSNRRQAAVPARVIVPKGQRSAGFAITTFPVPSDVTLQISAVAGGVTRSAELTVVRPPLVSLTLQPSVVTGGVTVTAIVVLDRPAPPGATMRIYGDRGIRVPEGQTRVTFDLPTFPVQTPREGRIWVTYEGLTLNATLTILPVGLREIRLAPDRVIGGRTAMGTVTLTEPAPAGGLEVALTSDSPAARVPPCVRIAPNETTATFSVLTSRTRAATPVAVAARFAGVVRWATLTVLPALPVSVTLQPGRVTGGVAAVGTVTLRDPAPAGGAVVTLTSSAAASAAVPATVTVPAGATSATFAVRTSAVTLPVNAIVIASYGGTRHAATLAVLPVPRDPEATRSAGSISRRTTWPTMRRVAASMPRCPAPCRAWATASPGWIRSRAAWAVTFPSGRSRGRWRCRTTANFSTSRWMPPSRFAGWTSARAPSTGNFPSAVTRPRAPSWWTTWRSFQGSRSPWRWLAGTATNRLATRGYRSTMTGCSGRTALPSIPGAMSSSSPALRRGCTGSTARGRTGSAAWWSIRRGSRSWTRPLT